MNNHTQVPTPDTNHTCVSVQASVGERTEGYKPTQADIALEVFIIAGCEWIKALSSDELTNADPNPASWVIATRGFRTLAMQAHIDRQDAARAAALRAA